MGVLVGWVGGVGDGVGRWVGWLVGGATIYARAVVEIFISTLRRRIYPVKFTTLRR